MWSTHWVLVEAPADAEPEDLHDIADGAIGPFGCKVYDTVLSYGEFPAAAIGWHQDQVGFLNRLTEVREQRNGRFQGHLEALAGMLGLAADSEPERIGAEVFRRLCNGMPGVEPTVEVSHELLPCPGFAQIGWLLDLAHGIYTFDLGFFHAWTGDALVPAEKALATRAADHAPGQDSWLVPLRLHT